MAKYRVWQGDKPGSDKIEIVKVVNSIADAIKFVRKNSHLKEDTSGIQVYDGGWDEWLDEDDQNIHEHLYMYGGKSEYLHKVEAEVVEEFDDDFEEFEDYDEEAESEELDELVELEEDDLDNKLMNVISGTGAKDNVDEDIIDDILEDVVEDEIVEEIAGLDDLDDEEIAFEEEEDKA